MKLLSAIAFLLLRAAEVVFGPPTLVHAMTAATAARNTQSKEGNLISYPVAASTTIYQGTLVCITAAGYLTPAADTQGLSPVVGVAFETVDNSAGAAGALRCRVESGRRYLFTATSITQAMLGEMMYVVDDQTIDDSAGATNDIPAGILVEFVSTTSGWIYVAGPTIGNGSVSGALLEAGIIQAYSATGQDETMDTTIPVTGVAVGDRVLAALVFATAAAIATLVVRASTDFTVTATDEVTVGANAANNTNNQYVFFILKA